MDADTIDELAEDYRHAGCGEERDDAEVALRAAINALANERDSLRLQVADMRAGYETLDGASDTAMRDGDLARDIATRILTTYPSDPAMSVADLR